MNGEAPTPNFYVKTPRCQNLVWIPSTDTFVDRGELGFDAIVPLVLNLESYALAVYATDEEEAKDKALAFCVEQGAMSEQVAKTVRRAIGWIVRPYAPS